MNLQQHRQKTREHIFQSVLPESETPYVSIHYADSSEDDSCSPEQKRDSTSLEPLIEDKVRDFDRAGASLRTNENHTLIWPVQPAQGLNRLMANLMSLDGEAYNVSKSRWNKQSKDVGLIATPRHCYHSARHAS